MFGNKVNEAPKGHGKKRVNNCEHVYNVRTDNRFWVLNENNDTEIPNSSAVDGLWETREVSQQGSDIVVQPIGNASQYAAGM